MFRKTPPKNVSFDPPSEKPMGPVPRVEVDDRLASDKTAFGLASKIDDINFSDPSNPQVLFDGAWQSLKPYRTKAVITLSDFKFSGGWYPSNYRRKTEQRNWHESLQAIVRVGLNYRGPVLTFMDGGERRQAARRPQHTIFDTRFYDVSIHRDQEFESHMRLEEEQRSHEEYYHGSPIKIFASPEDADKFLREQILCYTDDFAYLYKDEIALKGDRPQLYRYPEIVFSRAEYRSYSDEKHVGLYGSNIALPTDVFEGLRRALTDFREGLIVTMRVWLELYGVDPKEDYGSTDGYYSKLTLIPASAQLTGKIDSLSVKWENYSKPFHSITPEPPDL